MGGVTATPSQINAFQITERVTSIFSLLGIFFILSTFLLARGFDKPINRLIFFASWSNLGMNIASLIGQDGITAGADSSLCQFQAFAIQMFLGVDVFWALCMALNVYLALFHNWTAKRMRAQEWKYFIGCYGASFIPALVYLFVNTESRGRVYAPALLWCWVSPTWDFLRVATLYGIVWVAILFAFIIYSLAFRKVWRQRHELHGLFNPFNEDPFAHTTVKTEITVTSVPMPSNSVDEGKTDGGGAEPRFNNNIFQYSAEQDDPTNKDFDPYTVDVEVGENKRRSSTKPELFQMRDLTRRHALHETNPDAWLYARVAFLFFCALLISWVPSSINRLYSIIHPQTIVFGLNYTETLVLPLQGFWNALVYIITSQTACRNLWRGIVDPQRPPLPRKDSFVVRGGGQGLDAPSGGAEGGMTKKAIQKMKKGGERLGGGGGGMGRGGARKLHSSESAAELTEVYHRDELRR